MSAQQKTGAPQKKPSMASAAVNPSNFGKETQKPKNMWGTIKRLATYTKKNVILIVVALFVTIACTVMQVYSPRRLGEAVTAIFEGLRQGTGFDVDAVGLILITVAALYLGIFLTTFLQQRLMVLVSQRATYTLRNELRRKMNRVPVSYFDQHSNGNLMSIASNDVDNIVTNLQETLTGLISSVILLVGFFWMMMLISPLLTAITLLTIPCSLIFMAAITPKTKKYTKAYFASLGELNGQIEETYQGFSVVKSFNGETANIAAFDAVNENMVQKGWRARFMGGIMMPGMSFVSNIIYVLLAVVGSINVVAGAVLIGDLQAFFQYSSQFSQPIMRIMQGWGNFLGMLASAERIFAVLDANEIEDACAEDAEGVRARVAGAEDAEGVRARVAGVGVGAVGVTGSAADAAAALARRGSERADAQPKVAFEHVRFGYGEPLMKDFCMEVEEGQMVAIVGHTGAGKTTLINLLERFYEIQGGSIRIDGKDIRSETYHDLRSQMGMVLQDTWLFSGSIYDNIRYGNEDATDEQVFAAAKAAFADDFIQKLPEGYDTRLNEDADNISQGQRQLITIARAFVSDPHILILDEATSNVDSRTEMVIQSAMKRLLKGRTSFVVAHRLSTIYDADRILVMNDGDIVETGSHKELLAKAGVYASIYQSQFAVTEAA
jgi:ATP-binding cassette subfamily B protein